MDREIWSTLDGNDRTTVPSRVRAYLHLGAQDRIGYELYDGHVRITRHDGPPPPRDGPPPPSTWRDWIGPAVMGAGLAVAAVFDWLKKK